MNRPFLLRLLPDRAKQSLYHRYYHQRHQAFVPLFETAPLTLASGLSMYDLVPGDLISGELAFNGYYELPLSRRIIKLGQNGGLLVDVGANMGYFSLLWTSAHPGARAIAFEVSPRNISIFQNNIAKNNLQDRITLVPRAAGFFDGVMHFDLGPQEQTGWGGVAAKASPNTIEAPVVRLDDVLSDTPVDVLKIDVEGADTWVLSGCENLLRKKRIGTVFFEQNQYRMAQLNIKVGEAQTFLQDLGYNCEPIGKSADEWIAYPSQPSD